GALDDDQPRHHGRDASRELLNRRADRHERAAHVRRRDRRHERLRAYHPRRDGDEEHDVYRDDLQEWSPTEARVEENQRDAQRRSEQERPELAESVRRATDERPRADREEAGDDVDERQLLERDAEVVDAEGAAERQEHEGAGAEQDRRGERLEITPVGDGGA